MSLVIDSVMPAPRAGPLMAAMVGLVMAYWMFMVSM